ncbi:glycoside hydrolase family 13 protein [Streptomyces sp. URMC 126]|uniref:glycoside hydrolase family 13 protein n=1 Tax=Streptomyces sp. URMC 126 TaxID=3423401 RepID=UPI003F1E3DA5
MTPAEPSPAAPRAWWRDAVVYQVYPRSFADGDGDGTGDLAGLRARLPYVAELGADALWITPWYRSPMADGGYDVADHRSVDPLFGTLEEAELLIGEARDLGLRVILDVVPNHLSREHPLFRAALAAPPGSPERRLFHFRPGRGEDGAEPPNNWRSEFGGPAWTRTTDADGRPGEWYLHLFSPGQPDVNWDHPAVREEFTSVLRFWFDRGVAGIRVDSANLLAKDADLPDLVAPTGPGRPAGTHPYVDREDVHAVYRSWRRVADSYGDGCHAEGSHPAGSPSGSRRPAAPRPGGSFPGDRILLGELWIEDGDRLARYLRPDELHTAFTFALLKSPWTRAGIRAAVDGALTLAARTGAPASWVLGNHDVTRTVTRYGRRDTSFDFATVTAGVPTDPVLGTRRARAAALLTLALPGSVHLYQGEELGLPEVEDLPPAVRRDPVYLRSGGADPGRDGCRVPLPWSGDAPPYGFTRPGRDTWLPQPDDWADRTVAAQERDPGSVLRLYRRAIRLRRTLPGLRDGAFAWLTAADGTPEDVLAFRREDVVCAVNFSARPAPLPAGHTVLLSSEPETAGGPLPPHAAAWLRPAARAPQADRRQPPRGER